MVTIRWVGIAAGLTLLASSALADPVTDANAGMAALNRGDNAQAASLFTNAIISGQLSQSDLESAYVERATAYAALQNNVAALADVSAALALNPNDADAASLQRRLQASAQAASEQAQAATADDAAFNIARNTDSLDAYKAYLSAYPNGRHAAEADKAAQGLEVYAFNVCNNLPDQSSWVWVSEVYEPLNDPSSVRHVGWIEVDSGKCHTFDQSHNPQFNFVILYPTSKLFGWANTPLGTDTPECVVNYHNPFDGQAFDFSVGKGQSDCPGGTTMFPSVSLRATDVGVSTYTIQ